MLTDRMAADRAGARRGRAAPDTTAAQLRATVTSPGAPLLLACGNSSVVGCVPRSMQPFRRQNPF